MIYHLLVTLSLSSTLVFTVQCAVFNNAYFTDFTPDQTSKVQGSRPAGSLPRVQRRFQSASDFRQPSSFSGENFPFSQLFSGNIIEQTRAQVSSAVRVLKSLKNSKEAAPYMEKFIENSICFNNLDDAIEAIEASAQLVENGSPEILNIVTTVENMKNEKNITKQVLSSAHILRVLEVLIPKITEEPSKSCNASPVERLVAFKDLARLLEDVANTNNIQLPYFYRQMLRSSSRIVSEVSLFLGKLNKSVVAFDTLCTEDKAYTSAVFDTIGDIAESLAVLFDALGVSGKATEIRKKGNFVKKIVDTFDFDSSVGCGTYGSFAVLAHNLEDIAEVLESVGIEKLSVVLGIDLGFINQF